MGARTTLARTLPLLVTVVGVFALTTPLVFRPAAVEVPVVEVQAVELELPPGMVDATESGLIVRRQSDGQLSLRQSPGVPHPPGFVILTTRGPLPPEQLDAIAAARPRATRILVYAYDHSAPDMVLHRFTPELGWQSGPLSRQVLRRPSPYSPEDLRRGPGR